MRQPLRELDAEGGEKQSARVPASVALLSDVDFLFLVDSLNKEDERAQESNYGAADSEPQIFRIAVNRSGSLVFPEKEIDRHSCRDQADYPGQNIRNLHLEPPASALIAGRMARKAF